MEKKRVDLHLDQKGQHWDQIMAESLPVRQNLHFTFEGCYGSVYIFIWEGDIFLKGQMIQGHTTSNKIALKNYFSFRWLSGPV